MDGGGGSWAVEGGGGEAGRSLTDKDNFDEFIKNLNKLSSVLFFVLNLYSQESYLG